MNEISVIIPTYNRRERLRKALDSVLAQEEASFDVWVVDDGSTDSTREMIESDYPQVHYHWQKNQGPSAARNRGIEKSKGPWIAFLDSDDEWLPGKLKTQLHFLKTHPEILIAQTNEIWIRNGVRVNPMDKHKKRGGWIFNDCLPLCMVSPSAVMIHRTLFEKVGTFDESLPACEDYDLWLRIAYRYQIGLIEEALVTKYGGHPDQRSHEFEAMDLFRIESLINLLSEHELTDKQKHDIRNELQKKVMIYTKGARKRGKHQEAKDVMTRVSEATAP